MKNLIVFWVIIVFSMVTLAATAQTGGMNVGSLNANESIQVGTASENVVVLNDLIALPPLTDSEILLIVDPAEGSIVYATKSDVLLVFDGSYWKRADGTNDQYLDPSIPCTGTFEDYDHNIFHGVQIGTQCWMDSNLEVTHYPDGTEILHVDQNAAWAALDNNNTAEAYCYYNDPIPSDGYGALYTFAAAIANNWTKDNENTINGPGAQGICPDGWHLPTDAEWTILSGYLDPSAGGKMKENGTAHWSTPNNGATNESGFTGLPGGSRHHIDGTFGEISDDGYWWSATEHEGSSPLVTAWARGLYYNETSVIRNYIEKSVGFSVRCLRD